MISLLKIAVGLIGALSSLLVCLFMFRWHPEKSDSIGQLVGVIAFLLISLLAMIALWAMITFEH